jgi:hypothetical protein
MFSTNINKRRCIKIRKKSQVEEKKRKIQLKFNLRSKKYIFRIKVDIFLNKKKVLNKKKFLNKDKFLNKKKVIVKMRVVLTFCKI